MAIYRGIGSAVTTTDQATIDQVSQDASDASVSATNAASSASSASGSASAAASSASAAATSESNAAASETAAASSESNASTSETNAAASETAAAASETAAAASETAAAASETAAAASETAAADSESAAASSASAAATSATAAASSATAAAASESTVAASATAAAASETAAAASETAAAASESAASTSETNAASSATSAASSASSASTSATNAASSATAAAASETAAAASESAAATSETNAAASESAASTSETNAAASATAAASSATDAASSATAAQAAEDAALAALDSFDDRYLGQKTSDPTLDNDGNALVAGALYFNTTDNAMKVYDGSNWLAAYASLSGALIAANNLSDIVSASSARTNLGLGTAATTASTDYATAAQGTLADSALQDITGESIEDLSDVATMTPTDGQLLTWDSATSKWNAEDAPVSLPNQTGASGYYLTTNGTSASWDALATVANSGAYSDLSGTPTTVSTFTNDAGYLTSFTETDPVYTASSWYTTTNNSTNWDTAYGWGDHASGGYLTGNQTITLSGDVSGSGTTSISVTVADDSHNHIIANVDGLQTALDAKQAAATALTTSTSFGGDVSGTYNAIVVADDSHNHVISNVDGLQTALDGKQASGTYLAQGGSITSGTVTTLTSTTANITTVDLGNWTVTESAGVLYFATSGTNKMKLDASGNLTVVGDVTAYGTV